MPKGIYKRNPNQGFQKGHKHSQKVKDKIGLANSGKKRTEEFKLNVSNIKKGNTFGKFNKGRKLSEEHKKKIGRANKVSQLGKKMSIKTRLKISYHSKEHWKNPEYQKKVFESLKILPNKPEKRLIKLFKENDIPLHFVGDGKLIIDGKCPDFVCNPKKKVVLFHGDYWHYLKPKKNNPHLTREQVEQEDIGHYKRNFFDCLIIWEHQLKHPNKVLKEVQEFVKE